MALRSVLQTARGRRPERALCAYPAENKCSTDPDFRQQLSIGGIEDRSRATLQRRHAARMSRTAAVGDAVQPGANVARARRERRPKAIPGQRSGSDNRNLVLQNRELFAGEQGANRERTGENFARWQGV